MCNRTAFLARKVRGRQLVGAMPGNILKGRCSDRDGFMASAAGLLLAWRAAVGSFASIPDTASGCAVWI